METHDGFSTAGPSARTLPLQSKSSHGFARILASARQRAGLAILLVAGFLWACEKTEPIGIDLIYRPTITTTSMPTGMVGLA